MTSPWDGPRHSSWASNTVLTRILLVIVIAATVISDAFGDPPTYLVGLLGTAAGAFFTALGSDKGKRESDVSATATRAEAKADKLGEIAAHEHPDAAQAVQQEPPFNPPTPGGAP